MLSPENFIQWTYEDFLKHAHTVPYTYFPLGTRKLKNLTNRTGQRSQGYHFNSCLISFDDVVEFDDLAAWKEQYQDNSSYYRNQFDSSNHSYCFDPEKSMTKLEVIDAILPSLSCPLIIANYFNIPKKYQSKFLYVPVLLSALISRYWFWRYRLFADYQPQLKRISGQHRFLCYIENWSNKNTNYKLFFLDQLVDQNISASVKSYFNDHCQGQHYRSISTNWPEISNELEKHFDLPVTGDSNIDIAIDDFNQTAISIIASDYFQLSQPVLTKEIFKTIAAGHPFLLLAPMGTLDKLKKLGFWTFDMFWDESYDQIKNHNQRLTAVLSQINNIATLDRTEFSALYQGIVEVCDHNRKHFFSEEFEEIILSQYQHDLSQALDQADNLAISNPGGALSRLYQQQSPNPTAGKNFCDILEDLKGQWPQLADLLQQNKSTPID